MLSGLDGVSPFLADAVDQADRYIRANYPRLSLHVTSGYRAPAYQASLRARWDRGDRRGLVARPASNSAHSAGRAVDLVYAVDGTPYASAQTPLEAFEWLADLFLQVGVRWGGAKDRVHFEV